jgi:hypothetical protein
MRYNEWQSRVVERFDTNETCLYLFVDLDSKTREYLTYVDGKLTSVRQDRNVCTPLQINPFLTAPSDLFGRIMTAIISETKNQFAAKEAESKKDGQIEEMRNHQNTLKEITHTLIDVIAGKQQKILRITEDRT